MAVLEKKWRFLAILETTIWPKLAILEKKWLFLAILETAVWPKLAILEKKGLFLAILETTVWPKLALYGKIRNRGWPKMFFFGDFRNRYGQIRHKMARLGTEVGRKWLFLAIVYDDEINKRHYIFWEKLLYLLRR